MNETEQIQEVRAYLDEWEDSYGMETLPHHWGIATRIYALKLLVSPQTKYYCRGCGKTVKRDRGRWLKQSYCETAGRTVWMRRVR